MEHLAGIQRHREIEVGCGNFNHACEHNDELRMSNDEATNEEIVC
jgi:hypothetical protein